MAIDETYNLQGEDHIDFELSCKKQLSTNPGKPNPDPQVEQSPYYCYATRPDLVISVEIELNVI